MRPISLYPDIVIPKVPLGRLVIDAIKVHGDRVAWIDVSNSGEKYSFNRIRKAALKCANALYKEGIKRNDIVGVLCPNSCQQKILVLALALCGCTIVPVNNLYSKDEVERQMQIVEPKILFTSSDQINKLECCSPNVKVYIFGPNEKENVFLKFLEVGEEEGVHLDGEIDIMNDDLFLLCSSGTTGPPKLIQHTNHSMVAGTQITRVLYKRGAGSASYTSAPMFHVVSIVTMCSHLMQGSTLVLPHKNTLVELLELTQQYKVTHAFMFTPKLFEIMKFDELNKYDVSTLQEISIGGSPSTFEIKNLVKKKLDVVSVLDGYGLTEGMGIACTDVVISKPGSVGFVVPNVSLKIMDIEARKELGANKCGEIMVQSVQTAKGYYKNPEATKNMFEDGWLKTGDMGYYDEDGNLYITDRIKDVIKVNAVQVSPTELESVLMKHPKVSEVGVIGVPDTVGFAGEVPKAFIVKKDQELLEHEVHEFIKDKLADYKQLRGGVVFIDALPRSGSGKILKRDLLQMHQ
uniref:4-coumarate--CoA ligase 1-like isoform X1 n=1 Tax=Ciona intestinalis TaxID=7719 RepID=UPI00089DC6CF|nr:4-coumarate--CoA ligase 1-like isoform X1 [Ciona intestinalis]|eukprot:XP_018669668.1 4-coumarate--CoA ligase 1-like isoform X1 [Ciona intestinalis]